EGWPGFRGPRTCSARGIMRHSSRRWVVLTLLALAVVGAGLMPAARGQKPAAPSPPRQDPLRLTHNADGDSQPLILDADHISTWTEDGYTTLLLHGQVLIQQGVLHARFQQAVCWVDPAGGRGGTPLHLAVYGEGNVRLAAGAGSQEGPRAVLHV